MFQKLNVLRPYWEKIHKIGHIKKLTDNLKNWKFQQIKWQIFQKQMKISKNKVTNFQKTNENFEEYADKVFKKIEAFKNVLTNFSINWTF